MRKFGTLGLLTGTQVFTPSQLHNLVSALSLTLLKKWIRSRGEFNYLDPAWERASYKCTV